MELEVSGEIWWWRGPAPFHFVTVPPATCEQIAEVAAAVTYGWGMVPVTVRAGGTTWTTSLWPRDGGYVVPLKDAVRQAEGLALGDVADLWLTLAV